MTSPVSAIEAIEKAMEGVTPPDKLHVVFSTWKSDGSLNIRRWSTFMEFEGSTAYIAEPVVKAITEERDALARQAEALQRENAEKDERIAALEAGLELFAREADAWANFSDEEPLTDPFNDGNEPMMTTLRVVDLRRARTLIQGEKK